MLRFTIGDAAELAGDVGPDPRLIAVLAELDGTVDTAALQAAVAQRAAAFPLLSHRFVRGAEGAGRTRWERVDLDPAQHVLDRAADDPVAATVAVLVAGLSETIPPWRLFVLRSASSTALLFVAHHVLLDGVTAVAVAGALLGDDPAASRPAPQPPR
ncbi:MAG: wax ester/triacylglycerol synthase family O-acyltransferase, partial [Micropruina sp.]|uniref:wax ester/triacylglycerol synthase domain-containing protein n=1 Tax=Micropruina sp. TaxID=2737536 RepID=UPI0039E44ECA